MATLRRHPKAGLSGRIFSVMIIGLGLMLGSCQELPTRPAEIWTLQHILVNGRAAAPDQWQAVEVIRNGHAVATEPQMVLEPGDEITTGPIAVAVLNYRGNRNEIILDRETRVRLGSIRLFFGRMFESLQDFLKTETEYADAFPDGTRFLVEAHPGREVAVTMIEGRVRLKSPHQAWRSRTLQRYQRATSRPGTPPSIEVLDPDAFNRAIDWVNDIERTIRPSRPRQLVPRVTSLNHAKARRILIEKRLSPGKTSLSFQRGEAGTVVEQHPAAGTWVRPESRVDLVIIGESIEVPPLTNRTPDDARKILAETGLRTGRERHVSTRTATPGRIFRQDPRAGERVPKGLTVDIWIAQPPAPQPADVTVPRLLGKEPAEAKELLLEMGLKLEGPYPLPAGRYPPGRINRQKPAAGSSVPRYQTVTLWVEPPESRSEGITVPSLAGLRLESALKRIQSAGLTTGSVEEERAATPTSGMTGALNALFSNPPSSAATPPGTVLRQNPAAGIQVPPDTAIHLVVAADREPAPTPPPPTPAPASPTEVRVIPLQPVTTLPTLTLPLQVVPTQCTVPNLIGLTESQAIATLEEVGLKGKIDQRLGYDSRRVHYQSTNAGTQLDCGSTVGFTLGTIG